MSPPEREPLDVAIGDAIGAALAPYAGSFTIEDIWSAGAGGWFTEVRPSSPDAAFLSVVFDRGDTLYWVIGNANIECFPVSRDNADIVPWVFEIASAVGAGRVRETGSRRDASVKVYSESGEILISGGQMRIPWPWALRRVRTYKPYAAAPRS